ncbi:GNAT family N-acetyltransferase [Roseobacter sp. HKCCA0434]|uniref:GNAT family N-acetyltransferase n=1 Tax=Roseobacter sp. HKCCA0434 TaxID=3079297 RepID=UPI0029059093|nr:GNAT family N-acetyltransferase [Roseobacter sp. HKCCA0434]
MATIDPKDIKREDLDGRGRYTWDLDGVEAELAYTITSPKLRIADHTVVPDPLRGSGVGHAMVERFVADAKEEGFKILPLCPFVNAERAKHPDWADYFETN